MNYELQAMFNRVFWCLALIVAVQVITVVLLMIWTARIYGAVVYRG